jgi:hypothetical protein
VFDIAFIGDTPELQEDDWHGLWARTTLGAYEERFLAPVDHFPRAAYERQWLEAAERLLGASDRTGFFTSFYQFWWAMWREGETVYVQQELIIPERYPGPTDGRAPYEIIEDRYTVSEDGYHISEWQIHLDDIRDFVARRRAPASPA